MFLALKTIAGVFSKAAEKGVFLKASWLQENNSCCKLRPRLSSVVIGSPGAEISSPLLSRTLHSVLCFRGHFLCS